MPPVRLDPWTNIVGVGWPDGVAYIVVQLDMKDKATAQDGTFCSPPTSLFPGAEVASNTWTELIEFGYGEGASFHRIPNAVDKTRLVALHKLDGTLVLPALELPIQNMPTGHAPAPFAPWTYFQIAKPFWLVESGSDHLRATWDVPVSPPKKWQTATTRVLKEGFQIFTSGEVCYGNPEIPTDPAARFGAPIDEAYNPLNPATWTLDGAGAYNLAGLETVYKGKTYKCTGTSDIPGIETNKLYCLLEREDLIPS